MPASATITQCPPQLPSPGARLSCHHPVPASAAITRCPPQLPSPSARLSYHHPVPASSGVTWCLLPPWQVVTEEPTELVRINREAYNEIFMAGTAGVNREKALFLQTLPMFANYHLQHLVNVSAAFERRVLQHGETLFPAGHTQHNLVIVQSGALAVCRFGPYHAKRSHATSLGPGSLLGALPMPTAIAAHLMPSLVAVGDTATLLIGRALFEKKLHGHHGRSVLTALALQEARAWQARLACPMRSQYVADHRTDDVPRPTGSRARAISSPKARPGPQAGEQPGNALALSRGQSREARGGGVADALAVGAGGGASAVMESDAVVDWLRAQAWAATTRPPRPTPDGVTRALLTPHVDTTARFHI